MPCKYKSPYTAWCHHHSFATFPPSKSPSSAEPCRACTSLLIFTSFALRATSNRHRILIAQSLVKVFRPTYFSCHSQPTRSLVWNGLRPSKLSKRNTNDSTDYRSKVVKDVRQRRSSIFISKWRASRWRKVHMYHHRFKMNIMMTNSDQLECHLHP